MLDRSAIEPEIIRPLRRNEYERMVDAGLFADERIELIEGALVAMSPQGPRHAGVCARLTRILYRELGDRGEIRCQLPFSAGDDSQPEPDVAVHVPGDHDRAHPSQALLVVEVADSSLSKDRVIKARVYARAGVAEYWIVDLARDRIEVMSQPRAGRYARREAFARGGSIRLVAFPDVEIAASEVLGMH